MLGWMICQNHCEERPEEYSYVIQRYLQEAEKLNVTLRLVNVNDVDILVSNDKIGEVYIGGEKSVLPDFVIPYSASLSRKDGIGTNYYILALIRQFEALGVFVLNSSNSIEMANDKFYTKQVLAQHNICIPKTALIRLNRYNNISKEKKFTDSEMIEETFVFPVVVKLLSSRKGRGVFLCDNKNTFKSFMNFMFESNEDLHCVVQEYISHSVGRDLRVLVIGGKAIGAMQRKGNDDSFKSNMKTGAKGIYFELCDEIKDLAEKSAKALGLNMAGVDILFDENGYRICEVNAKPGFKMFESCNDVNVAKEILEFIISKC